MTLMDLPGAGESGARDTEYSALYREQLPQLNLVLWLIKADDRALAVDEHFYRQVDWPRPGRRSCPIVWTDPTPVDDPAL